MKASDVAILAQEGEGTTLEFKEGLPGAFGRELVAMANTIGGRILLGVRDDGAIVGVKDSNVLRARVQDIARNCDPPVHVQVEPVGSVLVVHVRESAAKPVQCSEGFFWRQGAGTQKLSRDEIRDYFRAEGAIRFDLAPCASFRYPQDFDRAKYHAWLKLSGITGRPRTEDVLVNLEAAQRKGRKLLFRNAGVLFFAKEVRRFFSQAYITCLLAKGADKVQILDRKDFAGGVVADIEEALRFVERNTRTAYRIERLRREEISEYPTKALREAITNAVMHRDWFAEGANVFVEVYSDRIEVVSPGGLPKGVTLADLGRRSVRRNTLIADLLHRVGFIEKAGTGVKRIREEARVGGYPEPVWEVGDFTTTILRPSPEVRALLTRPALSGARLSSARATGGGADLVAQSRAQSRAQSGAQSGHALAALTGGPLSTVELAVALGLASRTGAIKRALGALVMRGLVEYTLPDRPTSRLQRYRLTAKGRRFLKSAGATRS